MNQTIANWTLTRECRKRGDAEATVDLTNRLRTEMLRVLNGWPSDADIVLTVRLVLTRPDTTGGER